MKARGPSQKDEAGKDLVRTMLLTFSHRKADEVSTVQNVSTAPCRSRLV